MAKEIELTDFGKLALAEIRENKNKAKTAFSAALKLFAAEEAERKAEEKAAAAELARQLATVMAAKGISVADIAAKLNIQL